MEISGYMARVLAFRSEHYLKMLFVLAENKWDLDSLFGLISCVKISPDPFYTPLSRWISDTYLILALQIAVDFISEFHFHFTKNVFRKSASCFIDRNQMINWQKLFNKLGIDYISKAPVKRSYF